MKYSRIGRVVALSSAAVMLLTGCGGGNSTEKKTSESLDKDAKVSITFAGWSLDMTPEFKTLADGFHKSHPNITISVKQYSADDYDKQLTADISSGAQPDVFPLKNMVKYVTYAESKGLADISDIAKDFTSDKNIETSYYKMEDGKYYALPYRADSWVLFYNKDMFKKTGVKEPDGTWTWDDYTKAAKEMKEKLPAAGYDANTYPMYMHNWQSVVQSFALAQSGKSDKQTFLKGDFSYMEPFYKRALEWQNDKLTVDWNTSFTNKVQYQTQFGSQKAAMMPMGSWYAATLLTQRNNGQAEKFDWGMAPIPQNPDTKTPKTPITFGSPTSLAISSKLTGQKMSAAKEFVKWAVGEGGATELAQLSTTPAYIDSKVTDTFFKPEGMANDQQSKDAWAKHDLKLEAPVAKGTDTINSILKDTHSSIMTGTQNVKDGLQEAAKNVKDQGVIDE
ncbi:sugar ABC transporter substrate-binding protein [Bombiscardovia nodaiensis]|uniref:Sugar ABC transporter substrate-binding protein n=1 Tax=Bombiscardovia nodaiensis TaxID=2932181 RepID=A0ABM8B6I7_9BIFI|nr:sugar ABC transporter substrate-binding protein [Bombiscardovia nodaiensis]